MDRGSTIFTVAAVAIAAGLAAYAVYFDYKRRNDVDFRRKLSKCLYLFFQLTLTVSHRKGKKTR